MGDRGEVVWRTRATARVVGLAALLVALGVVDRVTGPDLSPSLFYLVPVALAAWSGGRRVGVGFAVASGLLCLVSNLAWEPSSRGDFVAYWNASATSIVLLTAALSLARLHAALAHERTLASTDHLTGLLNRRAFRAALEREVERAARYRHPLTVAYLDLDDFKTVNDRYGHASGDDLLAVVARTISATLRTTDIVGRLGGDEFAIAMPETDDRSAQHVVVLVHRTVCEALLGTTWPVTCSIGAVTFDPVPAAVDTVIGEADRLMYDAKQAGKNGVRLLGPNRERS